MTKVENLQAVNALQRGNFIIEDTIGSFGSPRAVSQFLAKMEVYKKPSNLGRA